MGVSKNQEDGSSASMQSETRKRKALDNASSSSSGKVIVDLTEDTPPKKRAKANEIPVEDKRLRQKRKKAPASYREIRHRALTQRMFVIDRQRSIAEAGYPIETVSLAGTTGNVYKIVIDQIPKCDCPHAMKGNQCKHVVYVLARVLRAPEELEYQLALTPAELRTIYANAPALPSKQGDTSSKDGNRKPLEGECPICVEDFDPKNDRDEFVYCKTSCGNNIHKGCFERWAATKRGGEVTCPFCRTPWQGDEDSLKKIARMGKVGEDGYVNVANELGIRQERDYSTYNRYWARRHFGGDYY